MSGSEYGDLPINPIANVNGQGSLSLNANAPAFRPGYNFTQGPPHEDLSGDDQDDNTSPHFLPPPGANAELWEILCTGPQTIDITTERNLASPSHPHFLNHITCTPEDWPTTLLPYISTLTFVINSTTDIFHFTLMLRTPSLCPILPHITSLSMPGFHWFSGISFNRVANPYVELAAHLPALRFLKFSLHAAGVTVSRWNEKRGAELESEDWLLARKRRVMGCSEVWERYGIEGLLRCEMLEWIGIVFVESESVRVFSAPRDPESVVRGVGEGLAEGFARVGRQVSVEVLRED